MRGGRQRLCRGLDGARIVAFHRLRSRGDCLRDLGFVVLADLITVLGEVFLSRIQQMSRPGSWLRPAATLLVLFRMGLSILYQLVDFILAETAGGRNLDGLFLLRAPDPWPTTCTMPLASMSKDTSTCGIPRGAGGNPDEIELAQQLIVVRHFPLALEDPNRHGRLIVGGRGEHLALLGRNRGVPLDQFGEHAAERFDPQ